MADDDAGSSLFFPVDPFLRRKSVRSKILLAVVLGTITSTLPTLAAEEGATYLLKPNLAQGETARIALDLEVGGEMLIREATEIKRLPLSVDGHLSYQQQILAWSADTAEVCRSLRRYQTASATIRVEKNASQRSLPSEQRLVVAEIREGLGALSGGEHPLTRQQVDLIHVVGNSLAIDRLLPGRELAEGESWDHDKAVLGALLGMDHVAVCEVTSVITGQAHRQVQIRMSGTVHGTIDGASTEIDLRGAYLFHLDHRRITKFNLAVQEKRSTSEIVPGLDVVAKVRLTVTPLKQKDLFDKALVKQLSELSRPLERKLLYDAHEQGFRFYHDAAWYVTAEQRDLLSLRCLQNGDLTGHCNVSTLPARSAGRQTTLQQFERDVRDSLGENLETISAATQWETAQGYNCLGVIANGKVESVPVQWRYYLIAAKDLTRVSIAVAVEQSRIEQFADADRELVDTLKLIPKPTASTATAKSRKNTARE